MSFYKFNVLLTGFNDKKIDKLKLYRGSILYFRIRLKRIVGRRRKMGLNLFRARMSMDEPVTATGVSGFYRTRTQFDADVWPSPAAINKKPRAVAVPVPPPQIPHQNPLAVPKKMQNENENSPETRRNSEASDEEDEAQVTIPRASVDLLREKNMEEIPKTVIMRKKKGMAPKPHGYMSRDKNSNEKEMAI